MIILRSTATGSAEKPVAHPKPAVGMSSFWGEDFVFGSFMFSVAHSANSVAGFPHSLTMIPPLPAGEGRGEGETPKTKYCGLWSKLPSNFDNLFQPMSTFSNLFQPFLTPQIFR
jgi:hypothetical protein